jgi:hypothetical protein
MWLRRAEVGTGVAIAGYLPTLAGDPFYIGRHGQLTGYSATDTAVMGGMGGAGVITLAEVCAAHDAWLAHEDLIEVPGKTDFLFSVKQDTLENGGVLPATLKNRKGTGGLSKVGSPQLAPVFSRAAGW